MTREALRMSERLRLAVRFFRLVAIGTINILVLVMCERDTKLRDKTCGLLAMIREWRARRIFGCAFDVAIRADPGNRPLARKELLPMTIQARCVLRKVGNIFAVSDLVTRIARKLFFTDVRRVGKV